MISATTAALSDPAMTIRGPFYYCGGYADECVTTATALDGIGFPVRIEPTGIEKDRMRILSPFVRKKLAAMQTSQNQSRPTPLLHFGEGQYAARSRSHTTHVFRTTFETDSIPRAWIKPLSDVDEIWVPSTFNRSVFASSGLDETKLLVLPEGIDTTLFSPSASKVRLKGARSFKFLSVFKWEDRKGIDVLLASYLSAFSKSDDVSLILKVTALETHTNLIADRLSALICDLGVTPGEHAHIQIMTGLMNTKMLARLYASVDAFVLTSRGEGCGRPYMEALSSGLPVIATRWSGQLDFLNDANSFLVDIESLELVKKNVDAGQFLGHRWALPSHEHAVYQMRQVVLNREEAMRRARQGRTDAVAKLDIRVVAKNWYSEVARVSNFPDGVNGMLPCTESL